MVHLLAGRGFGSWAGTSRGNTDWARRLWGLRGGRHGRARAILARQCPSIRYRPIEARCPSAKQGPAGQRSGYAAWERWERTRQKGKGRRMRIGGHSSRCEIAFRFAFLVPITRMATSSSASARSPASRLAAVSYLRLERTPWPGCTNQRRAPALPAFCLFSYRFSSGMNSRWRGPV